MINKEQVEYVANLARINISDKEAQRLGAQMSDVVAYIDKLSEVDVTSVEPLRMVSKGANVWREDEVKKIFELDIIKSNMPDNDGNSFKVPNVI